MSNFDELKNYIATTLIDKKFFIFNILAVVTSWYTWHSVPWAIIHGIFGEWYILYWIITNI